MKIRKGIVSLALATAMALSVNGMAFAANTGDQEFDFSVNAVNYNKTTEKRNKDNKTPVYLYITDLADNSSVYVRAMGVAGSTSKNLTENGTSGDLTDHVTCKMGTTYSIHSQIKEQGYGYAKLAFKSKNLTFPENVKGKWSPDSTRTYTHATK